MMLTIIYLYVDNYLPVYMCLYIYLSIYAILETICAFSLSEIFRETWMN